MIQDPGHMVISDPLAVFARQGMLKLVAPAKANLFLGIGNRRPDGYHEATTIMHALSLHDVLHMDHFAENDGGLQIELSCYGREGLADLDVVAEENLAVRAIRLLAKKLGRNDDESFKIRLEKHIPSEAGLGGGSSDAAAALVGAAEFWDIDPLGPEVLAAAAELGSDVSFFLYGGCVCMTGAGELYSHRLDPMKKAAVLVKPDKGVSTALAYKAFDENPQAIPQDIAQRAMEATHAQEVPLFNNLAEAAETLLPELEAVRTWLEEQPGVEDVLLCGSGSTTIALCGSFEDACKISGAAQLQGWWARATTLSSLRAAIVPK